MADYMLKKAMPRPIPFLPSGGRRNESKFHVVFVVVLGYIILHRRVLAKLFGPRVARPLSSVGHRHQ